MVTRTGLNATVSAGEWSHKILSLREQCSVRNRWLEERLNTVLPEVMGREGFDMWIVSGWEYNEDPVLMSMLPEPNKSARRRTIFLFYLRDSGEVEKMVLSRWCGGSIYTQVFDERDSWGEGAEDQLKCLRRLIEQRNPARVGINISSRFPHGDGMNYTDYQQIIEALGPELAERIVSAERLAVGWLERRSEEELRAYPGLVEVAHAIIAEAFSSRVIHPGITTYEDVAWWMRERVRSLGLRSWFHPSIYIQGPGEGIPGPDGRKLPATRDVILPGDMLHCDFGVYYLGLATDTQQLAYVLKPGETEPPEGLKAALADGNRMQDILMEEYVEGRLGNEILKRARARAEKAGIRVTIYSHPIGFHGHGAGCRVGLPDQQEHVPDWGEYELRPDTCYSLEFNIQRAIPEWGGQVARVGLEQNIMFRDGRAQFLAPRQTRFHLVE